MSNYILNLVRRLFGIRPAAPMSDNITPRQGEEAMDQSEDAGKGRTLSELSDFVVVEEEQLLDEVFSTDPPVPNNPLELLEASDDPDTPSTLRITSQMASAQIRDTPKSPNTPLRKWARRRRRLSHPKLPRPPPLLRPTRRTTKPPVCVCFLPS